MEQASAAVGGTPVPEEFNDNALIRKLSHFAPLSVADCGVLDELVSQEERMSARVDIFSEGTVPQYVFVVLEGMAVRYRDLPDGGRQLMTFFLPGDLCDMHALIAKPMDHSISAITPVRLAAISPARMMDIFAHHPRISAALWWNLMQEEAMLRERIVALGRRDARGRIAYFLCEMLWRYTAIGMNNQQSLLLPLTQTELGDTLGLTPVHINRILKEFRENKLIKVQNKMMTLLKLSALQQLSGFTKDYLLLDGTTNYVTKYLIEEANGAYH
jgi:CRP-like cAMP-binding protein